MAVLLVVNSDISQKCYTYFQIKLLPLIWSDYVIHDAGSTMVCCMWDEFD